MAKGSPNPKSGHVPLNYRQGVEEAVVKAVTSQGSYDKEPTDTRTSYIPGEKHKPEYRNQYNDRTILPRNEGCTPLRRFPNGILDHKYVAHEVIDIIHKIKDGGFTTDFERALLTLILPASFKELIDPKIAQTMTKLSNDERMIIALIVEQHLREELNYNSGLGGGSVPGRSSTRS
jgi:hypothetical protein